MRALEIYEGATIILTADHGESLGEHGISCAHKGVHETTTHVPLIVRVPGVAPGVVGGLVSTLDVYPTLFDFLDLPLDNVVRGSSLLGLMDDLSSSDREQVFAESAHGNQVTLRTPTYRAHSGPRGRHPRRELPSHQGSARTLRPLARSNGEARHLALADQASPRLSKER